MDLEPRENSDLLSGKSRVETNGNVRHDAIEESSPPDGGFMAYAVMVGSFLTNGLLFGVINSYSVIYTVLKKQLELEGYSNPDSRAALVGALSMGTTFLMSPLSGVLTELLGLRLTAVLGGLIATAGLILSSFLTHNVDALNFTYGIMYGLGASFAYTPSLAILGHYFKKHLGKVNGVVTVGSSVFTVIISALMELIIKQYGLAWMFRIVAVLTSGVALCGLLFRPLMVIQKPPKEDGVKAFFKRIVNIEIWRNKRYRFWALSMPIALFGYFVPYVHIKKFMEDLFVNVNYNLPLHCIATTSALGRLIFGYISDRPGIDRIFLQQISFYVIGTLTIILPFVRVFWMVVLISLGMGVFDGAFIALIGPIAFELCGGAYAPQAIGCMLGLAALPLSIGPTVAGHLYSLNKSYTLPFVLAGVSPLVGATLMFTVRLYGRGSNRRSNTNGHVTPLSSSDVEKSPAPLLTSNGNTKQQTTL